MAADAGFAVIEVLGLACCCLHRVVVILMRRGRLKMLGKTHYLCTTGCLGVAGNISYQLSHKNTQNTFSNAKLARPF